MGKQLDALKKLLHPNCHSFLQLWAKNATPRELKGMKLIFSICKHKGKGRFRTKSNARHQISFKNATAQLRQRQMRTYYSCEFGYQNQQQDAQTEIFKHKDLAQLQCSKILTAQTLNYIQQWIKTEKSATLKNHVLQFLRGIQAALKTYKNSNQSQMRASLYWFTEKQRERASNLPNKTFYAVPIREKRGRASSVDMSELLQVPKYFVPPTPKERLASNLRGSGDLIGWVSNLKGKTASMYSSAYTSLRKYGGPGSQHDFKTSIVGALVPDLSAMAQL